MLYLLRIINSLLLRLLSFLFGSHNFYFIIIIFSITSRVCKTLRGSSDDIGWLQRTAGMAPVEDGTSRFLELLAGIRYQTKSIC